MNTTLASSGFVQETFDAFLESREEPSWLTDMRRDAWTQFLEARMPSREDEEWMRTDIRLFRLSRFGLPLQETPEDSQGNATVANKLPMPVLTEGVELGGRTASLDSGALPGVGDLSEKWAKQGVLFGGLENLLTEHGDLLRPYFEQQVVRRDTDKFSLLSAACWAGGTLLYVPRGVQVSEPLHSLSAMSDGGVDLSRTMVILEEGADATLLAETASTTLDGTGLHCGTIELLTGPGANLRYVNLQNWGRGVWHFAHQKALVDAEATLQWTIGALGSRLAKVNQHVALTGSHARAQVNGVMFTEDKQHLSYHTLQHHEAPDCRSDLLYKGALQDSSRTVWRGMIKVDTVAQKTDGYQRNDNLMLSTAARADSIPGLEIEADDVRCTHGATSGRVDEEQIFYARSRGLTRREAVRMIVTGFFQQVFDRITIESVRDALGEAISRRVHDLDE